MYRLWMPHMIKLNVCCGNLQAVDLLGLEFFLLDFAMSREFSVNLDLVHHEKQTVLTPLGGFLDSLEEHPQLAGDVIVPDFQK